MNMVSPERYQAGYVDALEKKLFMMRDRDGKPNPEVSKVIRYMQRELGSQPCFIGLAPIGSSTVGYGMRENHGRHNAPSDVDFAVFYDSSIDPEGEKNLEKIFDSESVAARRQKAYNLPVHMPGTFRHDLNLDRIKAAFHDPKETGTKEAMRITDALVSLTGLAVGPAVDRYRLLIGKEMKLLPDLLRKQIVDSIADWAIDREQTKEDGHAATKMQERVFPTEAPERVAQMLQLREELWRERVMKVYGLVENAS